MCSGVGLKPLNIYHHVLPSEFGQLCGHGVRVGLDLVLPDRGTKRIPAVPTHGRRGREHRTSRCSPAGDRDHCAGTKREDGAEENAEKMLMRGSTCFQRSRKTTCSNRLLRHKTNSRQVPALSSPIPEHPIFVAPFVEFQAGAILASRFLKNKSVLLTLADCERKGLRISAGSKLLHRPPGTHHGLHFLALRNTKEMLSALQRQHLSRA